MRCIQISLLCMQQHPEDKPSMASVVLTLGRESALPKPKEPGFFKYRGLVEANSSSGQAESPSNNETSTSLLEARCLISEWKWLRVPLLCLCFRNKFCFYKKVILDLIAFFLWESFLLLTKYRLMSSAA